MQRQSAQALAGACPGGDEPSHRGGRGGRQHGLLVRERIRGGVVEQTALGAQEDDAARPRLATWEDLMLRILYKLAVLFPVLLLAFSAGAHVGDRVYPIPQLTDEMLEKIRFDDGSVDKWYDLVGEPTMTLEDFKTKDNRISDPSDLDFRIWLAWHDDLDRLYVAFSRTDDVYIVSQRWNGVEFNEREGLNLTIDGDHSGFKGYKEAVSYDPLYYAIDGLEVWWECQQYLVFARANRPPSLWSITSSLYRSHDLISPGYGYSSDDWTLNAPYGDVSSDIHGENPTNSVMELYITPFDSGQGLDSFAGPENVEVSDLKAGEVIGFAFIVSDVDSDDWKPPWVPEAIQNLPQDNIGHLVLFYDRADIYLDGLLLPAQIDSDNVIAVESTTWGRIKAALDME